MTLEQVQQTYGQIASFKEIFYDWGGGNIWLFKAINGLHSPSYDDFMLMVTQLGNSRFFPYYLGILAIFAFFALSIRKLRGKGAARQQSVMWFGTFIVLITAFALNIIVIHTLKDHFEYPRPYVALSSSDVVQVEKLESDKNYASMPSGHVAFITLLVVGLWPVLSPHMRLLGMGLIALVAWSRVALGVHFPADTVWSVIITVIVVYCVRTILYALLLKFFGLRCGGSRV